jgi:ribosome-binding factor A
MARDGTRAKRVAEQVQRTLAEMLRREVRDPRLKPVTVTHVRMSPDLAHAWVQYSMLGADPDDPLQREILAEAAGELRGPLGRALHLRIAPVLHFEPDRHLEHSAQLDELITRAVREDAARHVENGPDGAGDDNSPDPADRGRSRR